MTMIFGLATTELEMRVSAMTTANVFIACRPSRERARDQKFKSSHLLVNHSSIGALIRYNGHNIVPFVVILQLAPNAWATCSLGGTMKPLWVITLWVISGLSSCLCPLCTRGLQRFLTGRHNTI